jgi:BirA family biotin operon repressor/biotin-[acetyl-CoA-carboxylase] ligase
MTLSYAILQNKLNRPFQYHDSVDSTNDIAKQWLQSGAPSGAVVLADEQKKGRGRKGRTWYTPPNVALAVSVILKLTPENLSRINIIGALSVYDLAEHVGCASVGIKWPNDVQINGKKVSGILPEAVWNGEKLEGVVLGMGINVRNDFSHTELMHQATTLESEAGHSLHRADLISYLLHRIDHWYTHIDSDDSFATWKARLNMLGKRVMVDGIEWQAIDIDPDGALQIQDDTGQSKQVVAGDIFVVQQAETD